MKALRILFGIFYMSRAPDDYTRIEKFRKILRKYSYYQAGVRRVNENAATRALMQAKPLLDWNLIDVNRLRKLPAETLGYHLMAFLDKNGLSPLSYAQDKELTDEEFYIRRAVQTHDIWHVVLGYDTDILSEIGLNSFMLAQISWPPAGFYIGSFILHQMLTNPARMGEVLEVITRGWTRGLSTSPLFAVLWEDQLARPVCEIRLELGIS